MLTVLHGHSIEKLREMRTGSVHVWITSPPYWGLRDYGIPPSIWGGEENCEHEFTDETVTTEIRTGQGLADFSAKYFRGGGKKAGKIPINSPTIGFCSKCGAWRGQLGLEPTPELYVDHLVMVLDEARRVLRDDGTLWLNLGDSYAANCSNSTDVTRRSSSDKSTLHLWKNGVRREEVGIPTRIKDSRSKQATNHHADFQGPHRSKRIERGSGRYGGGNNPATGNLKPKDLVGIPWMVAFSLRANGWYLRSRIPWLKRNCMPESVSDRPSTAIEDVFLFSKSEQYFYDNEAVKVPQAEYERLRRVREADQGLETVFQLRRDGKTGIQDPSRNGAVRTAKARQELAQDGTRSRRNSDWFFESWQGLLHNDEGDPLALVVNTQPYPDSHFATFPEKLVEPMILAGASARGCCEKCEAPWERVTETGEANLSHQQACGGDTNGEYRGEATKDFMSAGAQNASEVKARILAGMNRTQTVGWIPTCKCGGYLVRSTTNRRMAALGCLRDPSTALGMTERRRKWYREHWQARIEAKFPKIVPCTVGDMFGGSGTTAQVAQECGRRAVLIEINAKYLPLIDKRTNVTPSLALAM